VAAGLNDDMIAGLIRSVGPETARDLMRFFLEESRERLHRIEDLAATAEIAELAREAHSLKSAAQTYGADALADMARGLEMACRGEDPEAVARTYESLAESAGGQLDALEARFGELLGEG
jgi:HPt (histidine-containing phosphotransfer) domain-containing protein